MTTNFNMRLDVRKAATNIPQIRLGQGDNQTTITVEVLDEGKPYVYNDGDTLEFVCMRPDGQWVHLSDAVSKSGDKWVCLLDEHVTEAAGLASVCYFCIKGTDGFARETTDRFELVIIPGATSHANLGPYSDQVDRLLRQCNELYSVWIVTLEAWKKDEEQRKANEEQRKANEAARVDAENARIEAEKERVVAEENRDSNENVRIENENARIENEQKWMAEIDAYISIFNGFLADVSGVMGSAYYRDEMICIPINWTELSGDTMYVTGEYDVSTNTLWLVGSDGNTDESGGETVE